MRDLNPVMGGDAGYGCSALDINNAGQIIGGCGPNVRLTLSAPATDVGIELIPSAYYVTQGSPLSYSIKVSNAGALSASGVTVTDLLPAGVSMVSAVPSQGSCTGTSSVVCALGNLNVDGVATIALVVTPSNTGSLSNSVSVATNEVDVTPLNNTASATVSVNALVVPADLSVTISGPGTAISKQNITYTMTVKNSGPAAAKTVSLRNLLAANLYIVSSSTTLGTCSGGACSLGTMAAGTTATVKLVVRPLSRGTYTSTSSVTFGGTDNNTANNSATITTVVK